MFESPPQSAATLLGPSIITGGEQGVFAPLLFMALLCDNGGGVRVGVLERPYGTVFVSCLRGLWGGFCMMDANGR